MKFLATAAVFFLLFPSHIYAARCKVNGEWYAYDSPQCSPDKIDDSVEPELVPGYPESTPKDKPSIQFYVQPKIIPAYQRPWLEVSYEVEERCKNAQFPPLAAGKCRSREETGYWAMNSNFGLLEDVALEAKAICIAKSEYLHKQSSCMELESFGYQIFTLDYAMPANYLSVAKAKCLQQHKSYLDRGECMANEESDFDKKYGQQFYKPRRAGGGQTIPRKPIVLAASYSSPGPPRVSAIARFSTNPTQRTTAEIATNRSVPPRPMHIRERALHLGIDSSDFSTFAAFEAEMKEKTVHFVLTTKEPMVENKGFLEFVSPETMDPKRGALISPISNGQVILHLSVKGGRTYLIDFVINSWDKGSYRLTAESGEQVYEDMNGAYNHVIAQLAAVSLGWTQIALKQDLGAGFYLHSVAVTSVEQALLPVKSSGNQ